MVTVNIDFLFIKVFSIIEIELKTEIKMGIDKDIIIHDMGDVWGIRGYLIRFDISI
jgi:hypothetical protein